MSVSQQQPWTVEQFFEWADGQEGRYEFDGFRPVGMTGGTINHGIIMRNLHRELDAGLRGSPCRALGPDVGVATVGTSIRYPDALITCAKLSGTSRTAAGVVAAFEIVSPTSGGVDRNLKVREYAAVASMRHYVIVESIEIGVLALHRTDGDLPWIATALSGDDTLDISELGVRVLVSKLYEQVDFGS